MITDHFLSLVTAVVAAAAFLLSLYNFYVERRDKRPRLTLWLSQGEHTKAGNAPQRRFFIEAANPGDRKVLITNAVVRFGRRKVDVEARNLEDGGQQATILPGENTIYWLPLTSVTARLQSRRLTGRVKAVAQVRDAVGNLYRSRNAVLLDTSELPGPAVSL